MDSNTTKDEDDDTDAALRQQQLPYYEQSAAVSEAVQKALDLIEAFASRAANKDNDDDATEKDDDDPWKQPDRILQQLDQARTEIQQAWAKLHAATELSEEERILQGEDDDDEEAAAAEQQQQEEAEQQEKAAAAPTTKHKKSRDAPVVDQDKQILRMAYLDMITDAFADCLEDLRNRQNNAGNDDDPINVETLVDCLQSGLDLLASNNRLLSSLSETDFEFNDGGDDDGNRSDDDVKLTPHESRRRQLGFALQEEPSTA